MKKIFLLSALAGIFVLTGCNQYGGYNMSRGAQGGLGGAAGGALIGQVIGKDTRSTVIGAAIGGVLGYVIGNEMDKNDKNRLYQTYESQPSGQTVSWTNPDSGNYYSVTPEPAYSRGSQSTCRDAMVEAIIDGRTESAQTTACRNSSGRWVVQ